MERELSCQVVADEDLIPRFVLRRLTPAEAERLEEHCFACEACWAELQTATALASSLEATPELQMNERRTAVDSRWPRLAWSWLAAAATLVLAVGIGWQFINRAEPPSAPAQMPARASEKSAPTALPMPAPLPLAPSAVTRKAAPEVERSADVAVLTVKVGRMADGSIQLAWAAVPGAASYRIGLYMADGREAFVRETADTVLAISNRDQAALPSRAALVVQAEARDAMRAVIARSQPSNVIVNR